MELKDLAKLIADYRHAIKEVRRTGSQTAADEVKKLEAKVDHVLACIQEGQKELF